MTEIDRPAAAGAPRSFVIEEFDILNRSPGFKLAAKGWAENVANDRGPDNLTLGWDNKTIVAKATDEKVVGVLVWTRQDHIRDAFIVLGYVDASYRRRGVYTALYEHLVAIARRDDLGSVSGDVAYDNAAMRACAERQGRRAVAITYTQDL